MQPTRTTLSEKFRLQSVGYPKMITGIGVLSGRGDRGKVEGPLVAPGRAER